ncbi:MAG: hypothetical protein PXY39_13880 [archaeon]|nr:hypothetical protein [archaeon]
MKGSFLALGIFGLLLILFGTVFALQGSGMIGGSPMTGKPFWIYAGSGISILGLILAALGFYSGGKRRTPKRVAGEEKDKVATTGGVSASGSEVQDKENHTS